MTEQSGRTDQPEQGDPEAEAAETVAGTGGAGSGAGAPAGAAGAGEDADTKPTIDDFAEKSGPDRRSEADKLPPVPAADGGATAPHPGGRPI